MKIQLASIIILSWIDRIPAFKYLYGVKNQSNSPSAIQVVIIYSKVFDGLEIWGGNQRLSLQGVIKTKNQNARAHFQQNIRSYRVLFRAYGHFWGHSAFLKHSRSLLTSDIISGGFTNFLTEFEWAKSLKKGQIISIDYF